MAFRVDWAARIDRDGRDVYATELAPQQLAWREISATTRLPGDDVYVECVAPFGDDIVMMGRRGGPEFLDSELARLSHLLGLAATVNRT